MRCRAVIDSCICVKVFFGDGDTQEPYRLRLRAALLLRQTLPERQEIRKAVHDPYKFRNRIANGQAHRPDQTDTQRVRRGLEICSEAVRTTAMRNASL